MQTVIFDGKKMDVIKYDKSLGTVEVPVVFGGENGRWCPLTNEFGPVVSIMVGEVIDMEDDIETGPKSLGKNPAVNPMSLTQLSIGNEQKSGICFGIFASAGSLKPPQSYSPSILQNPKDLL